MDSLLYISRRFSFKAPKKHKEHDTYEKNSETRMPPAASEVSILCLLYKYINI